MKILFALHGFLPELNGGTERTVAALGQAMMAAGHEVVVVAGCLGTGSPQQVETAEFEGLRVHRLRRDDLDYEDWYKSHHPGVSRRFAALLDEERPDVLHLHHWLRLSSDLLRCARVRGIRTVATLHDYFAVTAAVLRPAGRGELRPPPGAVWQSAEECAEEFAFFRRDLQAELDAAQLLLAPSAAHAAALAALAAGDLSCTAVQHPPLLELPGRAAPSEPGGRRLLTWGSLYPDKGLRVLFAAMRASRHDWSLRVLGEAHDPEYQRELEEAAAGLDVTFAGAFRPAQLSAERADFAVFPSLLAESYGLVIDEARALGLPVLCSDLPAFAEHLPAAHGHRFAVGDAGALAALLDDTAGLARLRAPQPPSQADAASRAAELLDRYAALAPPEPLDRDAELEECRAELLMRRAERRLWSALNGGAAPPASYPS